MSHLDTAPDSFATDASDPSDARWRGFNEFGVMLAVDGHWEDARQAFDDAVEAAPSFGDAPAVHAVLLSNLAQARFHIGDTDGAIEMARRSMAARVLCADAHDAPMARIRSDLAVYLAASGALDDAQATLQHAIHSLEQTFGAHDSRLLVPLENDVQFSRLMAATSSPQPKAPPYATPDGLDVIDVFPSPSETAEAAARDEYALEFVEELPPPPPRPAASAIAPSGIGSATPEAPLEAQPKPASPSARGLGFEVQYGIPTDLLLDGPRD